MALVVAAETAGAVGLRGVAVVVVGAETMPAKGEARAFTDRLTPPVAVQAVPGVGALAETDTAVLAEAGAEAAESESREGEAGITLKAAGAVAAVAKSADGVL